MPEDNDVNGGEENLSNMVAPPDMDIANDVARQTIARFRANCLVAADRCAVSGKGRSWCLSPAVGPALQACHIIPQQHYHLYPVEEDRGNEDDEIEYSSQRLRLAWQRTWSADNGILLLSHLHELFDARVIAINPDTELVHIFAPYDVVDEYHGRKAYLPDSVDRRALRHHYEMCWAENMTAKMLPADTPLGINVDRLAPSGSTSPLSGRTRVSASMDTSVRGTQDENAAQPAQGGSGDPSKRTRPAQYDSNRSNDDDEEPVPSLTDDDVSQTSLSRCRSAQGDEEGATEPKQFRKRTWSQTAGNDGDWETKRDDPGHSDGQYGEERRKSKISKQFLADVNWELQRLQREGST